MTSERQPLPTNPRSGDRFRNTIARNLNELPRFIRDGLFYPLKTRLNHKAKQLSVTSTDFRAVEDPILKETPQPETIEPTIHQHNNPEQTVFQKLRSHPLTAQLLGPEVIDMMIPEEHPLFLKALDAEVTAKSEHLIQALSCILSHRSFRSASKEFYKRTQKHFDNTLLASIFRTELFTTFCEEFWEYKAQYRLYYGLLFALTKESQYLPQVIRSELAASNSILEPSQLNQLQLGVVEPNEYYLCPEAEGKLVKALKEKTFVRQVAGLPIIYKCYGRPLLYCYNTCFIEGKGGFLANCFYAPDQEKDGFETVALQTLTSTEGPIPAKGQVSFARVAVFSDAKILEIRNEAIQVASSQLPRLTSVAIQNAIGAA